MYWDNISDTIFDSNDALNYGGGYRHFLDFGPLQSSSPIMFENHSDQFMYSNESKWQADNHNHGVIEIDKSSERIDKNYNENLWSKSLNKTIGFHHYHSSSSNNSFSLQDNSSSSNITFNNSSLSLLNFSLHFTDDDYKVKSTTNKNIASTSFTYASALDETGKSLNVSTNNNQMDANLLHNDDPSNDASLKSYARLKENTESDSRANQMQDNNNSSIGRQVNDDLDKIRYIEFTNEIKNVANIAKKQLYNSKRDSVATIKNELHVLREATVLNRSLCEQNYEEQIETERR